MAGSQYLASNVGENLSRGWCDGDPRVLGHRMHSQFHSPITGAGVLFTRIYVFSYRGANNVVFSIMNAHWIRVSPA